MNPEIIVRVNAWLSNREVWVSGTQDRRSLRRAWSVFGTSLEVTAGYWPAGERASLAGILRELVLEAWGPYASMYELQRDRGGTLTIVRDSKVAFRADGGVRSERLVAALEAAQ